MSRIKHYFAFQSYGVRIRIESTRKQIIERTASMARTSLLGNLEEIDPGTAEHVFVIRLAGKKLIFEHNGEERSSTENTKIFYKFFESILRVTVAEYAVDFVFLHAGVVEWKGKAIIIPADSFQGKTTLVAGLVKLGAGYYSDEYAVLDKDGLVHPFARPLSIRNETGEVDRRLVNVTTLGGFAGEKAIPVGVILITEYRKNAKWQPKVLSPGRGMMEVIRQTIPINHDPDFSISILKRIASYAIILKSLRGDVKEAAADLLIFIDNHSM